MWTAKAEAQLAQVNSETSRITEASSGKIVCPVWGEDGVISAPVFFERNGEVVFKFPTHALTEKLFALWEACALDQEPWRLLTITHAGRNFSVDVRYPGQVAELHAELDPERIVRANFGADQWNDRSPEVREPPKKSAGWPWTRLRLWNSLRGFE